MPGLAGSKPKPAHSRSILTVDTTESRYLGHGGVASVLAQRAV